MLNRDNPCIQNDLLTLANCMPNVRRNAKRGDRIIGVQSTKGGTAPKILYIAIVDEVISSRQYFYFNCKEKGTKYRKRRDCIYGVTNTNKIFVLFARKRLLLDQIYWVKRIPQNTSFFSLVKRKNQRS